MYQIKPVFTLSNEFTQTSSMYKLKNLNVSPFLKTSSAVSSNSLESLNEKKILQRQEKLLKELYKLKEQLDHCRSEIIKKREQITENVDALHLFQQAGVQDFVINADPEHPPFSLLWLHKLWNLPVNITVHLHSSVSSLPEKLTVFNRLNVEYLNPSYTNVTFVWKKVGSDTQLILSPIKNKIILGEVNLLRFFDNIFPGDSLIAKTKKNEILDVVHRLIHAPNKEVHPLIAQLSNSLGDNNWFNESSKPTIVDAAIWSILLKVVNANALPQNLKKWMTSSSLFVDVKS